MAACGTMLQIHDITGDATQAALRLQFSQHFLHLDMPRLDSLPVPSQVFSLWYVRTGMPTFAAPTAHAVKQLVEYPVGCPVIQVLGVLGVTQFSAYETAGCSPTLIFSAAVELFVALDTFDLLSAYFPFGRRVLFQVPPSRPLTFRATTTFTVIFFFFSIIFIEVLAWFGVAALATSLLTFTQSMLALFFCELFLDNVGCGRVPVHGKSFFLEFCHSLTHGLEKVNYIVCR